MATKLAILLVYLAVLIGISAYAAKRQKKMVEENDEDSFALAGRQLGPLMIAMTITGSAIGGAATVGTAQNAFSHGISAGFYTVGWACSALLMSLIASKKVRKIRCTNVADQFGMKYGKKFTLAVACVMSIAVTMNCANQTVSSGSLLTGLMPGVLNIKTCMIISVVLFFVIAMLGGLFGGAACNIINVIVIYIGLVIACVFAIKCNGGIETINKNLAAVSTPEQPMSQWWNLVSGVGAGGIVFWLVNFMTGCCNTDIMVQSTSSAKNSKIAKQGILLGALFIAPAGYGGAVLGTIAKASFPTLKNAALALPTVFTTLPDWVGGLCLAGLWAAVVSTATCLMIVVSTIITNTIIVDHFKPNMDNKTKTRVQRIIVTVVAVVMTLIAFTLKSIIGTVMQLSSFTSGLGWLAIAMFVLPDKYCRKSTCWWSWGLSTAAFFATVIWPAVGFNGHPIYLTFPVAILGWAISLILDKRVANPMVYVDE